MPDPKRPQVFFDIQIGNTEMGKIIFALRADVVPKTAKNFIELCTMANGYGYKNCVFHRIIPRSWGGF